MKLLHGVEDVLYRGFLFCYGMEDSGHGESDAIIPHGYGLEKSGELLAATAEIFDRALMEAALHPKAALCIISTNHSEKERAKEDTQKLTLIENENLPNPVIRIQRGAENTIEEVRNILKALPPACKCLTIICDTAHMRSVRIVWRHFCPNHSLRFVSISATWHDVSCSFLMRSLLRWLFTNVTRHLLFRFRGVKQVGKMSQRFARF